MVLVTTAGEVGTEAALLLSRQDVPVRVLTRHPEKATALADAGAEIAVTSVILVSPAVPAQELGVPAPSRR